MHHPTRVALLITLCLHPGLIFADSYANNQNAVVVDSPQVAASFTDIEGVKIQSPAFLDPSTVPPTFANGTSGPTPQDTLGKM
jgi:hypothetical protein